MDESFKTWIYKYTEWNYISRSFGSYGFFFILKKKKNYFYAVFHGKIKSHTGLELH